jgi:hypothetical protein
MAGNFFLLSKPNLNVIDSYVFFDLMRVFHDFLNIVYERKRKIIMVQWENEKTAN